MYTIPDRYQYQVIHSDDKDVLVLAGAGSGKTFTLLNRIHYLVDTEDVDPKSILVLTFTRVAAEDMRRRYIQTQRSMYDSVPDFCTFHSFCYQLVTDYSNIYRRLGYESAPLIVNEQDLARYRFKAREITSCKLSDNKINNPAYLTGKDKLSCEHYHKVLNSMLKKDNRITFDELSEKVCKLIASKDESTIPIVNQYKYIFVDEFQDTDKDQFAFIMSMVGCKRMLFGDVLQNIYQFRGCSNKPLKDIIDNSSWKVYKLPVNYRSSSRICNYVNNKSKNFQSSKYRIELISDIPGPVIRTLTNMEDYEFYDSLAEYINIVEDKGSTAVLCRTNFEVSQTFNELVKRGLSVSRTQDKNYLVRLLESVYDDESEIKLYESLMSDYEYSIYRMMSLDGRTCQDILQSSRFTGSQASKALHSLQTVKAILKCNNITESRFMLYDMFDVEQPNIEISNNKELVNYLLNKIQCNIRSDIYVGTIHSVKGLEFDNVVVMNVGSRSFKVNEEQTENLFYTACTRAKKYLLVGCSV